MADLNPYWQRLRDAKLANTVKREKFVREFKKDLTKWYALQAEQAPANCENCGKPLIETILFHDRAHICHIVDKSPTNGCSSVATHPLNRWFGCLQCHTDSEDRDKLAAMPVLPLLQKRLKLFYKAIAPEEKRRVPEILLS